MHSRRLLRLLLPLMLLFACVPENEARGGRRGGGGMFGTWRKIKRPTSGSGSSSRRSQGQKSEIPYTPLKSSTQSKTQAGSYPMQQLPAGATYHANGAHLPAGATYHGVSVPPGGSFYASGAAMPPGAVYYAHAPPAQSSFSPGNFLIGMYAGQMMSHGLFGHRTYVQHVYTDQQQQEKDNDKKVIVIENGNKAENVNAPVLVAAPEPVPVPAPAPYWPTDADVPLAALNTTTIPPEFLNTSTEPIFKRSTEEQPSNAALMSGEMSTTPAAAVPAATAANGIICLPLLVSETINGIVTNVEKIICYPAPKPKQTAPQAADTAGIICVPRKLTKEADTEETDFEEDDASEATAKKQDCYPAPPAPDPYAAEANVVTKSPDSVIGNIPNEHDAQAQQTHAVLEALRQEEQDFFGDFESRN